MKPNDNQSPDDKYELVGDVVRIFRRGGKWYANYQFDGKQHRRSLKTTSKKEARRRAIQLEADLLAGRYQQPVKAPRIEPVVSAYKAHLRTEGRAKKTLAKIDLVCRRVLDLAERRKAKSIVDIDLAFVDQYRSERNIDEAMPKTIQNESIIIRQLVNFALRRRMITTDPLQGLKIKKVKPTRQPCWSWEEVEKILEAAKGTYRNVLILLANTGMRIGEAKWFTWEDISFQHNTIAIRRKDDWQPKGGEQRLVPMSPRVRQMLEPLTQEGRWVFTAKPSRRYPAGDHQISERRLLAFLKRLLKRLGLPGHLHTFRHSLISKALTSGIPEVTVRAWVGHLDPEVTRLYTHVLGEDSQAAMKRLNALQNPPINGKEVPSKENSGA